MSDLEAHSSACLQQCRDPLCAFLPGTTLGPTNRMRIRMIVAYGLAPGVTPFVAILRLDC